MNFDYSPFFDLSRFLYYVGTCFENEWIDNSGHILVQKRHEYQIDW